MARAPAPGSKNRQPAFGFWPWQVLSASVPLASVLGSIAVIFSDTEVQGWRSHELAILTAFTIYGAGNGFLLGAAIGDFGRSVLAMIAGAFTALILSPLYDNVGVVLGIPAITAVMMATLALHWDVKGIFTAIATGFGALFLATVIAGVALVAMLFIASIFYSVFRTELVYIMAGVLALMLGNVIFLGRIVRACYRVQSS